MAAAERPPFFWVFAALGLLCLGAFAVGGVSIVRDGHLRKAFGWTAGSDHAGLYIRSVDPTGIAAGVLEPGDRVLAWNGDRRLARVGLAPYQWSARTGETYQLVIHRAGRDHTVELRVPLVVESRQRTQTAALFLLGVFFAVVGVLIGLLRPVQGPARWVALAFIAGGLQHMKTALGSVNAPETGRPWIVDLLCVTPIQTICAYEFAIRFPFTRLSTLTRAFSSVLWTLGLTVVVTCIWTGVLSLYLGNIDAVARQAGWIRLTDLLRPLAFVAAGIAASWTLIRRYQFVAEPDLRRRLAWVVYGAIIGGTPLLLPPILAFATGARNRPEGSPAWLLNLYAISNLMTVALALSMSYAVLRHRVFDIRVVLRRTVQYALAKNVLMASLAVPAVALAYSVISNPGMTIAEFLSVGSPYVYVAAALGLTIRFRRVLRAYIDRQFFREAYDRDQLLMELLGRLDRLDSLHETTVLVTRELDAAFHPSAIHLWFRQEGTEQSPLESASGQRILNLQTDSALVRLLEVEADIRTLPTGDQKLDTAPDFLALTRHGIVLVVPLIGTSDRLQGLMFLGEKKSEEPYSGQDRRVLLAVGKQIAVVRENQALQAHVKQEQRIRHEVLGRLDKQAVNLLRECPRCGTCYDKEVSHCEFDGVALTTPLPVERLIAGRYQLERVLGRGAMGAVYEASDTRLERAVAVKILVARSFGDPAALRRFEREARVVASLTHPNVVGVYDYGALAAEGAFIVMELVRGITWRVELLSQGRFHAQMVAECVSQMCDGLMAAHKQGIVHRDLKPENVLIAPGDGKRVLKIVDFGVAKHLDDSASTMTGLTVQGAMVGTLGYMAPEQLAGRSIDHRVDVFAAGVMTWEALVGGRPFHGATAQEIVLSMSRQPPDLPLPGDSKELSRILQRAIAAHPGQRYDSIETFRADVIPALNAYGALINNGSAATDPELPTRISGGSIPQ